MRLLNRDGSQEPLWFESIGDYTSIATADFDPIATFQAGDTTSLSRRSTMNKYIKSGFGVKNATDNSGVIYAITWQQFDDYRKANKAIEDSHKTTGVTPTNYDLSGLTPVEIQLAAGEWCVTPLIKVFADNDATYKSTVTTINIGIIK